MKNTYKIDFVNNTLTMSKAFEEALNNPNSQEYKLFLQLRADFPGMTIIRKTRRAPKKARPTKNLTYKHMEQYMSVFTTFARHLRQAERSPGTIENYLRHVRAFAAWLAGRPVTKEAAADWKEYLLDKGYCPSTINSMLGGLNRFFDFVGWQKYQVKHFHIMM